MFDQLKNFIIEYFWIPIIDPTVHYNIYNTLVYAILFGVAALYLVLPLLNKLDVELNKEFFIGVTPYILMGGIGRSMRDAEIIDTFLLETPFIYIIIFALTLTLLKSSLYLEKRFSKEYWKIWGLLGTLILVLMLSTFQFQNLAALAQFITLTIIWSILGGFLVYSLFDEYFNFSFLAPIFVHYLDATSTVVGLNLGGEEKHILGNFFIDIFGPYGMFIMKSLVIIPVVYYIYEYIEDTQERNYYLFLITLLGLAITTRNMISIITLT